MTTKTHLARQEEFVDEVGIQIRATDPATPTLDQIWLNTSENRLKARVNNITRVYYDSLQTGSSQVQADGVIDGNKAYNHFMTLLGDIDFSFQNFLDGMTVKLQLENNQANAYRIQRLTLPPSTAMSAGNYWKLNSAANVSKYHIWYDFNGTGANEPVVTNSTPVRVIMTPGRRERSTIKCKSPAGNSSAGMQEWVKIWNAQNTQYYIWWDVATFGGDPFPPIGSADEIRVSVSNTQSAANVASLTAQAINNSGFGFTATAVGDTVTVENDLNGVATSIQKLSVNMVDSVATLVEGAAPNSDTEIAALTAAQLDLLADFSATSLGAEVTITYAQFGASDQIENVNITSGFTSILQAPGSGPINVTFPSDVKFENTLQPSVVPPVKIRLYEFVKMGSSIIGTYEEY